MDDRRQAAEAAIGNAAFVLALRERGVRDTAVLRAMEQVPREAFVPSRLREHARRDIVLPLPCGQSMGAPTTLAVLLAALDMPPGARVLEVGTGSGYASALLMRLGAGRVRSLERYATLARMAAGTLGALGLAGIDVEVGDGLGPIGESRFDRILVDGAMPAPAPHLLAALAPGGRLVSGLATGEGAPNLYIVQRAADGGLSQTTGASLALTTLLPGRAHVL